MSADGFRNTFSSGTIVAPVPFVLVSNTQVLAIVPSFTMLAPHERRPATHGPRCSTGSTAELLEMTFARDGAEVARRSTHFSHPPCCAGCRNAESAVEPDAGAVVSAS